MMNKKERIVEHIFILILTTCLLVNIGQSIYYQHEGVIQQPDRLIFDTITVGICLITMWCNAIYDKLDEISRDLKMLKYFPSKKIDRGDKDV